MLSDNKKSALEIAEANGWIQESNTDSLKEYINQAIQKYPEKVKEYQAGKASLLGLFMGEVMKLSKGKADAKAATPIVKEMLDNYQLN
jgi:aspartyl-tRNA(Asn)/glutamyl-tRNA(Gln) amidotransferase subunit B